MMKAVLAKCWLLLCGPLQSLRSATTADAGDRDLIAECSRHVGAMWNKERGGWIDSILSRSRGTGMFVSPEEEESATTRAGCGGELRRASNRR